MQVLKTIWMSSILALLLVGGLLTAWWMLLSQIHIGIQNIESIKTQTVSRNDSRVEAHNSVLLLRAHTDDIDRIKKVFVDPEPIELIKKLKETGELLGVKTVLSVQETPNEEHALVFRVSAEGPEKNVLQYFKTLENLPYLVTLGDFTFSRPALDPEQTASPKSTKLSVTITVQMK